ncbi:recombinase family protein, partial [Pontibacter sp. XAAS-A31]
SLRDLIDLVSEFQERGVDFVSLQDGINTATATGRFTFNIFASLAEFEREIIRERTNAGLAAAKARGRRGGQGALRRWQQVCRGDSQDSGHRKGNVLSLHPKRR